MLYVLILYANIVIQLLIKNLRLMSLTFNQYKCLLDPINLCLLIFLLLNIFRILFKCLLVIFLTHFQCNPINNNTFTKIICSLAVLCLKYQCRSRVFLIKCLGYLDSNNNNLLKRSLTKNFFLSNTFV